MIYIETKRLTLRSWKESDIGEFIRMNQDREVMRYFPNVLTGEESIDFARRIQKEFEEKGYGLYAVEEKESETFLGYVGLHQANFEADFTPCVEIGWRLKREAWGKGYATEAAKACLAYAFETLKLDKIYSFTAKINQPSKNVMKKIGMEYLKDFDHPQLSSGHPLEKHVLYIISSNE